MQSLQPERGLVKTLTDFGLKKVPAAEAVNCSSLDLCQFHHFLPGSINFYDTFYAIYFWFIVLILL